MRGEKGVADGNPFLPPSNDYHSYKDAVFCFFWNILFFGSPLEQQGFDVIHAMLFARPTPLAEGEAGMANWIQMFASSFLTGLSSEQQIQVIRAVEEYLKPTLYHQGTWTADYRRIRIVAIKL